jgi:hypothetical protein
MCGRFACGLAADVVRRLSTYMHSQTHESTVPPFIDLMPLTRSFRPSWNISPTSTWYNRSFYKSFRIVRLFQSLFNFWQTYR